MARQIGGSSPYYTAVDQTLREYVPLPFQEMAATGQAIQKRSDDVFNQGLATDTLLGSIEALAPGHKDYVKNQVNSYRDAQKGLYDKFNGNMADPEYIRQSKMMNSRFAADPNFRTIMSANERAKVQDKIGAQMQAEGKLFIKPEFTGRDASGNLTDEVGNIRGVNTLDNWGQRLDAASKAMVNDNRGTISNKANLNRAKEEINAAVKSGSPEVNDLMLAYKQQGMTEDQAKVKIANDIVRLQGSYAERTDRDNSYYSYQLALRSEARANEQHAWARSAHNAQMAALRGTQGSSAPIKISESESGLLRNGINDSRINRTNDFLKNFVDEKGNLKGLSKGSVVSKEDADRLRQNGVKIEVLSPKAAGAVTGGRASGQTTYRVAEDNKKSSKFAVEYLNEMRQELGWPKGKGSAREVAQHYNSFMKSDNMAPTLYTPTDPDVYKNMNEQLGNSMVGARIYQDGKESLVKPDQMAELLKNKQFLGFSYAKEGTGPQGSIKFQSTIGDGKKPVIYTIPLPTNMQTLLKDNLKLTQAVQSGRSNSELLKDRSLRYEYGPNKDQYAPIRSQNGLDYVKVDANGNIMYDTNRQPISIPPQILQQKLQNELRNTDDLLRYLYTKD